MILESLSRYAIERADEPTAVSPERQLTYRGLRNAVRYTADRLKAQGLGPRDTVGVTIAGEIDHLVAALALMANGCVQVVLPTHEPQQMRSELARQAGCTAVLLSDDAFALDDVASVRVEFGREPCDAVQASRSPAEELFLFTSSGTTGKAKIIPLSEHQIAEQAVIWELPRKPEVYFRPTSIEFNNARRHRLYSLLRGSLGVFLDGAALDSFEACRRFGVSRMSLSAAQASRMADQAEREAISFPANCHVRVAGSPMSGARRRAFVDNVTRLLDFTYGATETGAVATAGPHHHDRHSGSVGEVIRGVAVEIVDPDDRRLPSGEAGLVRVRAPGMAKRYINDGVASAKAFRKGWFSPGDVGSLDANGILTIKGRSDDMINLASINIFPSEIESVVGGHPSVVDCAAFGFPSQAYGDIPMVAVVTSQRVGDGDILAYARERLGRRAPRRVLIVDALPRNSRGKVVRSELCTLADTTMTRQRRQEAGGTQEKQT